MKRSSPNEAPSEIPTDRDARRSLGYAALLGIGVMAAIDEIVFHQLLQWHHFFDRATPTIGIVSDGLLHAGELLALVIGTFLLLDLARQRRLAMRLAWTGVLFGMGGFQLFDGIVSHKLLRIHQIRYDVDLLAYDLAWNLSAIALLLLGAWLLRRTRQLRRH
ncbi:DUF2243 domain-containing protein [Billgrantia saliphila]|uniref:DUF2243 domain-containing protein n=1 Tax=Billgrantia saliphila TaxID=1848458 RepID=UPI000CE32874|nr:DUF2243 domain-containing protein [Halomonas saliphila]